MSEVQVEGNITVYIDLCLRYMVSNVTIQLSVVIHDKNGVNLLLSCFVIWYNFSLFYTIQRNELYNSRQCHWWILYGRQHSECSWFLQYYIAICVSVIIVVVNCRLDFKLFVL